MKSYCINLPHRIDRWEKSKIEFDKHHFDVTRIDGVYNSNPKQGAILAHLNCIKLAKEENADRVLIFEDDILFYNFNNIQQMLSDSLLQLDNYDKDWNMFFLGANVILPAFKVLPTVAKLTGAYCLHAYIIQKHFYDILLNHNYQREIDNDICHILMPKYNCYINIPLLAGQRGDYSDIEKGYRDYNEWILSEFNKNLKF